MNISVKNLFFLCIITCIISMTIHIVITHFIDPIIMNAMIGVEIIPENQYGFKIISMAYITFLLPLLGSIFLYSIFKTKINFNNSLINGILFGLFLLILKGALFRQLIMNIMVGQTVKIALLQQLQPWVSNLTMALVIACVYDYVEKK